MSIEISDATIQMWIQTGIQSAINSMLRDSYGAGALLKKATEKAMLESEQHIVEAMKESIQRACVSPNFLQAVERDIAAAMANQYRGAFDGVIKAAAKQAANTEVIAQRVAELTKLAAGIAGSNSDSDKK